MADLSGLLLVVAVAAVGVLHTIVPDHWVPITLIARQRGWSRGETTRAAFQAGLGHVGTTLVLGLVVWLAGVVVAARFGHIVDTTASLALIAFGGWIAIAALREMHAGHRHSHGEGHTHRHGFSFLGSRHAHDSSDPIHGPEQQQFETGHGTLLISIFEEGVPPHFRVTGPEADFIRLETIRPGDTRQIFSFANRGTYWESIEEIPEPHGFQVTIVLDHDGHEHAYSTQFVEHTHAHHEASHEHGHLHEHEMELASNPLYAPLRGELLVRARHIHVHRHGDAPAHVRWHDHDSLNAHEIAPGTQAAPLLHRHKHKTWARTALLLILGSSPMVEGIPAFFAAGRYGVWLIILMALVFAASTITTYMVLCVVSTAGLQRVQLGAFERYGEVISGAFIMLIGTVFWIWSVL